MKRESINNIASSFYFYPTPLDEEIMSLSICDLRKRK